MLTQRYNMPPSEDDEPILVALTYPVCPCAQWGEMQALLKDEMDV